MKIGIDFDDTITDMPEFFQILTGALLQKHEVHIISYRDTEIELVKELRKLNITYTKAHVPPPNIASWKWKSELAAKLQLDLMIDDSPEVLSQMPANTKRLWLCDPDIFNLNTCILAMKAENRMGIIK